MTAIVKENLHHLQHKQGLACVYAIFCVDGQLGFIKVGFSERPLARIMSVVQGCPFTPERIGVAECESGFDASLDEKTLHRRLIAYRSRGEWFRFDLADAEQQALFEQYCLHGFSSRWATFSFSELKDQNRKAAAKSYAIHQNKKRIRSKSRSDNIWRDAAHGLGGFWNPRGRTR